MLRIVTRPVHAVLDYLWSAAVMAAPQVLDLENDKAKLVCQAQGAAATVGSLLTRYELGVVKVIPFNVHLMMDLISALFGLASPWLFGFADNKKARNMVLAFSLFELAAVAISQPDQDT